MKMSSPKLYIRKPEPSKERRNASTNGEQQKILLSQTEGGFL